MKNNAHKSFLTYKQTTTKKRNRKKKPTPPPTTKKTNRRKSFFQAMLKNCCWTAAQRDGYLFQSLLKKGPCFTFISWASRRTNFHPTIISLKSAFPLQPKLLYLTHFANRPHTWATFFTASPLLKKGKQNCTLPDVAFGSLLLPRHPSKYVHPSHSRLVPLFFCILPALLIPRADWSSSDRYSHSSACH